MHRALVLSLGALKTLGRRLKRVWKSPLYKQMNAGSVFGARMITGKVGLKCHKGPSCTSSQGSRRLEFSLENPEQCADPQPKAGGSASVRRLCSAHCSVSKEWNGLKRNELVSLGEI